MIEISSPENLLKSRFQSLIQNDKKLAKNITDIEIEYWGANLIVQITTIGSIGLMADRLNKIAGILLNIAPVHAIQIIRSGNVDTFLMADLIKLCPSIQNVKTSANQAHSVELKASQ